MDNVEDGTLYGILKDSTSSRKNTLKYTTKSQSLEITLKLSKQVCYSCAIRGDSTASDCSAIYGINIIAVH